MCALTTVAQTIKILSFTHVQRRWMQMHTSHIFGGTHMHTYMCIYHTQTYTCTQHTRCVCAHTHTHKHIEKSVRERKKLIPRRHHRWEGRPAAWWTPSGWADAPVRWTPHTSPSPKLQNTQDTQRGLNVLSGFVFSSASFRKPISSPLHADLSFYQSIISNACMCSVCVCVCLCVCTCVCMCVRTCVRACVHVMKWVYPFILLSL